MREPVKGDKTKVSARLFRSDGKESTTDRVLHKFKELLKSRELKPGDRIPNETELAASFGASRGSIREAVKMLVSFGILQVKWGEGTYVSNSVTDSVFDHSLFQLLLINNDNLQLLELREIMEMGLAHLAVKHADESDIEALTEAHENLNAMILGGERDADRLAYADALFHFAISRATHNPFLEKIYNFAMELYYPSIVVTHDHRESLEEMMQSPIVHQRLIDAIKARDTEAAQDAVRESLQVWYELL